jgi:hypothetical protein
LDQILTPGRKRSAVPRPRSCVAADFVRDKTFNCFHPLSQLLRLRQRSNTPTGVSTWWSEPLPHLHRNFSQNKSRVNTASMAFE